MTGGDQVDLYRAQRRAAVDRARRSRYLAAKSRGEETSLLPAAPIRRHAQALLDAGWSRRAVTLLAGTGTAEGLRLIVTGDQQHVRRMWAPILSVPLSVAPSPSYPGNAPVPTLGAVRRVRSLLALGWTHQDLRAAVGRDVTVFSHAGSDHLSAELWRQIDAAFEKHSGRQGPSESTRARCRKWGYLPPLAWDDIDDPLEVPQVHRARPVDLADDAVVERILAGEWRLTSTRADREAVIAVWRAEGRSLAHLARLTGWNPQRYYDSDSEVA